MGSLTTKALKTFQGIFLGEEVSELVGILQTAFSYLDKFLYSLTSEITGLVEGVDVKTYLEAQSDIAVEAAKTCKAAAEYPKHREKLQGSFSEELYNKAVPIIKALESASNRIVNAVVDGSDVYPSFQNLVQALKNVQQFLSSAISRNEEPYKNMTNFLSTINGLVDDSIKAAQKALDTTTLEGNLDAVVDEVFDLLGSIF